MTEKQQAAMRQALSKIKAARDCHPNAVQTLIFEAEELLESTLEQQPSDEPVAWMWKNGILTTDPDRADGTWAPLYTRPQPAAPEFYHHVVENEGDWSEWVNPDNDSYMMKCCDCGLVHEMQFKVAKYSEGDECEFVDDPDLQPVFRARRAEEAWQEKDTAHRAGGLPQPCPTCEALARTVMLDQTSHDTATELLKRCENEMRYAGWDKFESDNTARNGVYEQVKHYLEKNT